MKMTKKRLAALQRIIDRETYMNKKNKRDGGAGLHPSGEKFAVTDGWLVVLFQEQVPGLPEAGRNDFFDEYVRGFHKDDCTVMVQNPPTVDECRRIVRGWDKMPENDRPCLPRITISAVTEKGETITSCFNAELVLDALEAMGPYTDLFIGRDMQHRHPYPCLVVYPRLGRESWQSRDEENEAFLLPCRPEV